MQKKLGSELLIIPTRIKIIFGFCICGFAVAVVVLGVDIWLTQNRLSIPLSTYNTVLTWMIGFCPPSLDLMVLDEKPPGGFVAVGLAITTANTIFYGIAGALISLILPRKWMRSRE